ncbi:MAG: tetratricopeptide repeat protein [Deltaproteobacteria bacterium]|nr:tetratricopeptide repeat protein [Deltaproteobacteria bacterium]
MKKYGLGTRPSQTKDRHKEIDLDEPLPDVSSPRGRSRRGAAAKKVAPKRGSFWKMLLVAFVSISAGVLISALAFTGFTFKAQLDHVKLITGEREVIAAEGDTVAVSFVDGLRIKRANLKGFYRLFPPDDLVVEVSGLPQTANKLNEDLIVFMQPEAQTSYELLVSKGVRELGRITVQLGMDAAGWIARADAVGDKAIQTACYRKAAKLEPDSEEAHIALGRLYEADRKYTRAIASYEAVVRNNAANVLALKSLLKLYKKKGKRTRMITVYEKLARADESGAGAYYLQAGKTAEKVRDLPRALTFYRKVLNQNRANIEARQRLIKIYEADKQWKRAAANARVLLEYDSKNPDLYLFLSGLYLNMGSVKRALAEAQKAEKLKKAGPELYLHLAGLSERAGDDDAAIKYYKKALSGKVKKAAAYNNLGMLLEKKGRLKEALPYYEKAFKAEPKNGGYITNLADAYEKSKQWKKAIGMYAKIVAADKKNKAAWESLAVLHMKTKGRWKALEAYIALSKLEPKKVLWHQRIATLYEELGKLEKARSRYKTILKLDPKNAPARQKYVELSKQMVQKKIK